MRVQTFESEFEGTLFHLALADLENAVVAFFYEGSERIGTIALAMPTLGEGPVVTSSLILGGKYQLAARAIAERATHLFGKLSIVSLHAMTDEQKALRICFKLLEEAAKGRGRPSQGPRGR